MKEAHTARRSVRDGGSGSDAAPGPAPAADALPVPTHLAPLDREPLPTGADGDDFVSTIPFQARAPRCAGVPAPSRRGSRPPARAPAALTPRPARRAPRHAAQVLSWEPRAVFFPGFADAARCAHIVDIAAKRLAPSSLALRAGDTAASTADIRTSQGTFLTRRDDREGVLDWVEKRIAAVTMIPQKHGEPFNVLRYELGQKYDSHFDTFDPESYGPQSSQRLASFLLYLSDWEEGGGARRGGAPLHGA
jgi:hypothetical protein